MKVVHLDPHETIKNDSAAIAQTKNYFSWIIRTGIMLTVSLGFWYLILLNSLATSTFALEELKSERILIQKDLEKWEIELAIPTSLYALESNEQVQEMDDVTNKTFIEVSGDELAYLHSSAN